MLNYLFNILIIIILNPKFLIKINCIVILKVMIYFSLDLLHLIVITVNFSKVIKFTIVTSLLNILLDSIFSKDLIPTFYTTIISTSNAKFITILNLNTFLNLKVNYTRKIIQPSLHKYCAKNYSII